MCFSVQVHELTRAVLQLALAGFARSDAVGMWRMPWDVARGVGESAGGWSSPALQCLLGERANPNVAVLLWPSRWVLARSFSQGAPQISSERSACGTRDPVRCVTQTGGGLGSRSEPRSLFVILISQMRRKHLASVH